jgi:hydrogenase/urease accessory protein HupE
LPAPVQEYIEANPNATAEDIQEFMREHAPELTQKYKSTEDVQRLLERKASWWNNAADFLVVGMKHILSGPDHILFVVSLLLVFATIRDILRLTLTFTIAHSITLILAGTGTLTLSSRIVEPLIALSIAYVAFTSVYLKKYAVFGRARSKMIAVFFFGLFHGLGFAGLLKEIKIPSDRFVSSLFSFNLGIEFGQLCIVALALPLIYLCRKRAWYPMVIKGIAGVITVAGIIWMVQRIVG